MVLNAHIHILNKDINWKLLSYTFTLLLYWFFTNDNSERFFRTRERVHKYCNKVKLLASL